MDEMQAVNDLILALSASGIPFTRDAWEDENNDLVEQDYGVVELTGSPVTLWGDDEPVEQTIRGNVVLYVRDGADDKAKAIQDILRAQKISFALTGTEYLYTENKNRWTWRFDMRKYLLYGKVSS